MTIRDEINAILKDWYTPEEQGLWWNSPQYLFHGRKPVDMVADEDGQELLRILGLIDEGAYL